MKSQKKIYSSIAKTLKKTVDQSIRIDANSTTCMAVYQPKAPKTLKKFSKIEND